MSPWTTPAQIASKVRRAWDDGRMLRAHLNGEPFTPVVVPLRRPSAADLGAELADAQAWAAALTRAGRDGAAYDLETTEVGGRTIGRNRIPCRAVVARSEQAWVLLGVVAQVARAERLLAETRATLPDLSPWVIDHPLRALAAEASWTEVLAAVCWLRANAGQHRYLREIEAPGVDTKFVAAHRDLLAALLDAVLPAARIDATHSRAAGFAPRYGFAEPRPPIRMRVAEGFAGLDGISEIGLRAEEATRLRVSVQSVLVIENEVTYLSAPIPPESVVIWGAGYSVGRLGRIPWVRDAPAVWLWGDLDTHGFATLSLLRGLVPQTRSILMDRATLLEHRDRWGREPTPTRARLAHLTGAEGALYDDLVEDVLGPAVRLEQERIAWPWAGTALAALWD